MKKILFLLLFTHMSVEILSQNTCQIGYAKRNVKCNGKITVICVPEDLSCEKCWSLKISDCNENMENIDNSIFGGMHNTYAECLKQVEDFRKNSPLSCPQAGSKYLIVLSGAKVNLCDSNNSSSSALNQNSNFSVENAVVDDLIVKGDNALSQNKFEDAIRFYNEAKLKGGEVSTKIQMAESMQVKFDERKQQEYEKLNIKQEEARQKNLQNIKAKQIQIEQTNQFYQNQSKKLNEAIQDFGNALQNYFDRKSENENILLRIQEKDDISNINFLECKLYEKLNYFFQKGLYANNVFCFSGYAEKQVYDIGEKKSRGINDSINFYIKEKNYKKAVELLISKNSTDKNISDLKCKSTFDVLFSIYDLYYSKYSYNFQSKEIEKEKRNVLKGKSSYPGTLKFGLYCMTRLRDYEFAATCFQKVNASNTGYFKKSSLLFYGILAKRSGVMSNNFEANKLAIESFRQAFSISKSDFLELSQTQNTNYFFGYYFYPQYYYAMQLSILEELADSLYLDYKLTGNNESLKEAISYYNIFFASLN